MNVLYLNRLGEGLAPAQQTPLFSGPSGPDYRCFNYDKAGHWARECPKPKANTWARMKKFCKFYRMSTHDDSECKLLGRSVTIYDNIYNRFAYYSNIENTLLGMGDR